MWVGFGSKVFIREVGFEICFEEDILVQIDGGEKVFEFVIWLSKNTKRGMNLIFFEDRKGSV